MKTDKEKVHPIQAALLEAGHLPIRCPRCGNQGTLAPDWDKPPIPPMPPCACGEPWDPEKWIQYGGN